MNPATLQPFVEAETERRKQRQEQENSFAWLLGAYTKLAVASAMHNRNKYPEKPYPLTPSAPLSRKQAAQKFREYTQAFNAQRRGGSEAKG